MQNRSIVLSALMAVGTLGLSTALAADPAPATRPAEQPRITGTAADIKGSAHTVGGRDVPAPAARDAASGTGAAGSTSGTATGGVTGTTGSASGAAATDGTTAREVPAAPAAPPAAADAPPPADQRRITGTAADMKGTSNTIGGRDVPAPAARDAGGTQTGAAAGTTGGTVSGDAAAGTTSPPAVAPVPAAAPADQRRITGTAADMKGTSNTIGGRDVPAPAAVDTTVRSANQGAAAGVTSGNEVGNGIRSNTPKAVQDLLAGTVNDAANDGHFSGVISHLSRYDRDRMAGPKASAVDTTALNQRVAQFRKDWRTRYNEDFHIGDKNEAVVFNNISASPSVSDEARTAADTVTDRAAPSAVTPANQPRITGTAADFKGTAHTVGGRDVPAPGVRDAHAAGDASSSSPDPSSGSDRLALSFTGDGVPAAAASGAGTVPVVREGDGWKIDAPDTLSGAGLRSRLQHTFSRLESDKANWPNDVNEAYRVVSDRVLTAITAANQPE